MFLGPRPLSSSLGEKDWTVHWWVRDWAFLLCDVVIFLGLDFVCLSFCCWSLVQQARNGQHISEYALWCTYDVRGTQKRAFACSLCVCGPRIMMELGQQEPKAKRAPAENGSTKSTFELLPKLLTMFVDNIWTLSTTLKVTWKPMVTWKPIVLT